MSGENIDSLLARFPALQAAELGVDHRVASRLSILGLLPHGGTGVELGVFTGLFSEALLTVARPAMLHLVDPWWTIYGDFFPDWGAYTDHGRLPTRAAHDAAVLRSNHARGQAGVQVHVEGSLDWLDRQADGSLDWAYVDSTHTYDHTLAELGLLDRKLSRTGLILGDDWWIDPASRHHGVFRAVHAFVRARPFELIRADEHMQWAIRRAAA